MTINHIDQLTEWWKTAEQGIPREGDTYIARFPSGVGYETGVVDSDGLPEGMLHDTRILARAPKPKPAWHDAVAVIAWTDLAERQVWERDGGGTYCGTAGDVADDYELHDVTQLIEAKVTGEMVERARQRADSLAAAFIYSASEWHMREVLTAALGLETE